MLCCHLSTKSTNIPKEISIPLFSPISLFPLPPPPPPPPPPLFSILFNNFFSFFSQLQVTFKNPCSDVRKEIENRVNGQYDKWFTIFLPSLLFPSFSPPPPLSPFSPPFPFLSSSFLLSYLFFFFLCVCKGMTLTTTAPTPSLTRLELSNGSCLA